MFLIDTSKSQEQIFNFFIKNDLESITLLYHGSGDSGGVEDIQTSPELGKAEFNDTMKDLVVNFFENNFSYYVDNEGSEGQAVFHINDEGQFIMECSNNYFEQINIDVEVGLDELPEKMKSEFDFLLGYLLLSDQEEINITLESNSIETQDIINAAKNLDSECAQMIVNVLKHIIDTKHLEITYSDCTIRIDSDSKTVIFLISESSYQLGEYGAPDTVILLEKENVEVLKEQLNYKKRAA